MQNPNMQSPFLDQIQAAFRTIAAEYPEVSVVRSWDELTKHGEQRGERRLPPYVYVHGGSDNGEKPTKETLTYYDMSRINTGSYQTDFDRIKAFKDALVNALRPLTDGIRIGLLQSSNVRPRGCCGDQV